METAEILQELGKLPISDRPLCKPNIEGGFLLGRGIVGVKGRSAFLGKRAIAFHQL
jgi:hypothetical protein